MIIVYIALAFCLVFSHLLIFWIVRAGIRDSKRQPSASVRRRRYGVGDAEPSREGCQVFGATPTGTCIAQEAHGAVATVLPRHSAANWTHMTCPAHA